VEAKVADSLLDPRSETRLGREQIENPLSRDRQGLKLLQS